MKDRCPGLTGARVWQIQGLTQADWDDTSLRNETYGLKGLLGKNQKRAEKALKWALDTAKPGNRNATGHWLARRCLTGGLDHPESELLMTRYQQGVDQPGCPYTLREARATLRSVRRRYDPTKDRQHA